MSTKYYLQKVPVEAVQLAFAGHSTRWRLSLSRSTARKCASEVASCDAGSAHVESVEAAVLEYEAAIRLLGVCQVSFVGRRALANRGLAAGYNGNALCLLLDVH